VRIPTGFVECPVFMTFQPGEVRDIVEGWCFDFIRDTISELWFLGSAQE